jgi:hypothetical protein
MGPTKKATVESSNTPVMSTAKTTELELLLKIEQYKYKMMWFEHYRKPISGPRPLCKEHIEQMNRLSSYIVRLNLRRYQHLIQRKMGRKI